MSFKYYIISIIASVLDERCNALVIIGIWLV